MSPGRKTIAYQSSCYKYYGEISTGHHDRGAPRKSYKAQLGWYCKFATYIQPIHFCFHMWKQNILNITLCNIGAEWTNGTAVPSGDHCRMITRLYTQRAPRSTEKQTTFLSQRKLFKGKAISVVERFTCRWHFNTKSHKLNLLLQDDIQRGRANFRGAGGKCLPLKFALKSFGRLVVAVAVSVTLTVTTVSDRA